MKNRKAIQKEINALETRRFQYVTGIALIDSQLADLYGLLNPTPTELTVEEVERLLDYSITIVKDK
jgi:hypothetical protein